MIVGLDNGCAMKGSAASSDLSSANESTPINPATKKKRNLSGTPDPDAVVIALSPRTLLATNRFVCEICHKGFQRDQNLQLHRRGHNLPWKLKQRSSNDAKKRVYICPEPHCIHHDPSRALGDLTGIKKHFCRKHGEKKWKCDKCSKQYAVQSDWKAHSKICGTKEYKCDCGTLFSRRDSFVTHTAFCDALSEEKAKTQVASELVSTNEDILLDVVPSSSSLLLTTASAPSSPEALIPTIPDSTDQVPYIVPDAESVEVANSDPNTTESQNLEVMPNMPSLTASCISSFSSIGSSNSNVFPSVFASSTSSGSLPSRATGFTGLFRPQSSDISPSASSEPITLRLGVNHGSSIFVSHGQDFPHYAPVPQPALSATAILQKAAQMGATSSNGSLLRALGIVSSISSANPTEEWSQRQIESNTESLAAGLGLDLACNSRSSLNELMLGGTSVLGPTKTTLDFLGLGMGASGGSTTGLSAFMTSITRSLDVASTEQPFCGQE